MRSSEDGRSDGDTDDNKSCQCNHNNDCNCECNHCLSQFEMSLANDQWQRAKQNSEVSDSTHYSAIKSSLKWI